MPAPATAPVIDAQFRESWDVGPQPQARAIDARAGDRVMTSDGVTGWLVVVGPADLLEAARRLTSAVERLNLDLEAARAHELVRPEFARGWQQWRLAWLEYHRDLEAPTTGFLFRAGAGAAATIRDREHNLVEWARGAALEVQAARPSPAGSRDLPLVWSLPIGAGLGIGAFFAGRSVLNWWLGRRSEPAAPAGGAA